MKYFLGVIAAIILVVLAIVLVFRGGPDTDKPEDQKVVLSEYANSDAAVRYTMNGEIVAKEKHYEIRINVSRTRRTIELINGYSGQVERSQDYDNDINAFNTFLEALEQAGFAKPKEEPKQDDDTGVCPTGIRYIYELTDAGDDNLRLWSTSCSARDGTFAGKAGLVRQLFQAQIPDYREFTRGVQL